MDTFRNGCNQSRVCDNCKCIKTLIVLRNCHTVKEQIGVRLQGPYRLLPTQMWLQTQNPVEFGTTVEPNSSCHPPTLFPPPYHPIHLLLYSNHPTTLFLPPYHPIPTTLLPYSYHPTTLFLPPDYPIHTPLLTYSYTPPTLFLLPSYPISITLLLYSYPPTTLFLQSYYPIPTTLLLTLTPYCPIPTNLLPYSYQPTSLFIPPYYPISINLLPFSYRPITLFAVEPGLRMLCVYLTNSVTYSKRKALNYFLLDEPWFLPHSLCGGVKLNHLRVEQHALHPRRSQTCEEHAIYT